jgi:NAD-dependent SIR2 family protein deacetylase
MGKEGDSKVINLKHRRFAKKYKILFNIYHKFLALFQKQNKNSKKSKHQVQKPVNN